MPKPNVYSVDCPSQGILALIGSKWSMLILCALRSGPKRTGELKRRLDVVSAKMLTQRCVNSNGTASSSAGTSVRFRPGWNTGCPCWAGRWRDW